MDLARFWHHVLMSPLEAKRRFPAETMEAIAREIAAHEKRHRGEVCFVVEAELTTAQLWRGLSSRERAREVFSAEGIWNTEENNGVLIYVLLADRRVEIVADRGIDRAVDQGAWEAICRAMDEHFHAGRFREGSIAGVRAVSELLERHFPATGEGKNELADRPILR